MKAKEHFTRVAAPLPAPVIPNAFGGGLGFYDIVHDLEGQLMVLAGPWQGFIDGDVIEVLWGNAQAVVGRHVYAVHADAGVPQISVPNRLIVQIGNGIHPVALRVTAPHGEQPLVSPVLTVEVKFGVPGGLDPQPDTVGINEALSVIRVFPEGLISASRDVTVAIEGYVNRSDDDAITVSWAGDYFAVDPAASSESIVSAVDPSIIEAAGNGRIPVSYAIRDRVGNWSRWAPYAFVDVGVGGPDALPAPWVEGTVADRGMSLDLASVDGRDIVIQVEGHGAVPGEVILVHWRGFTATGLRVDFDATPVRISRPSQSVSVVVPYAKVADLGQGSVMVRYSIEGSPPRMSLVRTLDVLGKPAQLEPPTILLAVDGVLDPASTIDGVNVSIPRWPGMSVTDSCKLEWHGLDERGGRTYYSAEIEVTPESTRELAFLVPQYEVERIAEGSLKVRYVISTVAPTRMGTHMEMASTGKMASPWLALRVAARTEALSIDSTPATLSGAILRVEAPVSAPPAGAFLDRVAKGGVPPYRYAGSNGAVEVDAASGRVVSLRNGAAVVTVTDAEGSQASYPVTVSHVLHLVDNKVLDTFAGTNGAAQMAGTRLPLIEEWEAFRTAYAGQPVIHDDAAWSGTPAGKNMHYVFFPATGQREARRSFGFPGPLGQAWSWMVKAPTV